MQLVELTQSLGETFTEGLTDDSGGAPCLDVWVTMKKKITSPHPVTGVFCSRYLEAHSGASVRTVFSDGYRDLIRDILPNLALSWLLTSRSNVFPIIGGTPCFRLGATVYPRPEQKPYYVKWGELRVDMR